VIITEAIKEKAYELGFSLVGITNCEPLPHEEVFTNWLQQGKHGQMAYLETPHSRQSRANPGRLLEGCQSVVVLGTRYPRPNSAEEYTQNKKRPLGRLAAYAWGEDYHAFLPSRLKDLVSFIEAQLGHSIPNRWYSDTGPILERELAQRAGLGWIGKNTCLINPGKGSYFLLAEILLGIELKPDAPFTADRCGNCTRCIQACPTGCILPNRTLDARHCISYLTIELKGAIPEKLRPLMGNWVFGCDVCQLVCPWNRFAEEESDQAFAILKSQPPPDLLEELNLTAQTFNQKYRHSAIKRPKRRGYLRNVAVALGNLHAPQATPRLVQILHDESEPLVRAHAAWALGQIGGTEARNNLESALGEELDLTVRQEIHNSLFKRQ
jgi:epoxyqueuosine reductase